MYSPDYADQDPRNPANWTEREITRYYIDAGQFTDAELDALDILPNIEDVMDAEVVAKTLAKNIAKIIGRPVVISCGDDEDFFTEIAGA